MDFWRFSDGLRKFGGWFFLDFWKMTIFRKHRKSLVFRMVCKVGALKCCKNSKRNQQEIDSDVELGKKAYRFALNSHFARFRALLGKHLGRSGASLKLSWTFFDRFFGRSKASLCKHESKMGSKTPFAKVLQ